MSKDTISVNMNVYDIPIVVEQLKKLEQENKQLKEDKKKAIEYIKAMQKSDLIFTAICEKELLEILGDKENER